MKELVTARQRLGNLIQISNCLKVVSHRRAPQDIESNDGQ
jgi:hypothetical protein